MHNFNSRAIEIFCPMNSIKFGWVLPRHWHRYCYITETGTGYVSGMISGIIIGYITGTGTGAGAVTGTIPHNWHGTCDVYEKLLSSINGCVVNSSKPQCYLFHWLFCSFCRDSLCIIMGQYFSANVLVYIAFWFAFNRATTFSYHALASLSQFRSPYAANG